MKVALFIRMVALAALGCWIFSAQAFGAAAPSPALMKAKQDAEARGFAFETSRDEIIAKAKKEGKLRALSSLDPGSFKPMADSFKKKYPFIDIQIHEITGTEAIQRHLLELKAGTVKDWDVGHASEDFYNDFAAAAMKIDILGMAEQGVLKINPKMVDPENRAIAAVASGLCAIGYNKTLVAPDRVPNQLEDILRPEFKGKKFVVDIRPYCMAALMVAQGEEWVVNYARKIKEQEPVWVRGNTRALTAISVGEYAMHQLTNYHSCVRATWKDKIKALGCKVIEPVSARIQEPDFVFKNAANPNAALLFIEHQASPEGQKILDEIEPVKSSLFTGGEVSKILQGKKVSVNDFRTYHKTPGWMKMVLEAYGFPKAEIR
ncbi:MAG: ABC transporter substrate-binding protein [Candidatus Binatia bacterium]